MAKQPFAWYGGKQNLVADLLPIIPPHVQYVEVFSGGASVFWNKHPSKNEVLNDKDGDVTNFYYQLKTNFSELQKMIQGTLHSEIHYKKSREVLESDTTDMLLRAWAFWCQCELTFSHIKFGGFAFGTTGSGKNTANKRDTFTERFAERLRATEIFNRDAVELIELKDHKDTLFYVDPPYVSSDQGGYKGYTMEDFDRLLSTLKNCKGKFILSSYPEDILMKYREECGWRSKDIRQIVQVSGKREETKYKVECITFNFNPPNMQVDAFSQAEAEATSENNE